MRIVFLNPVGALGGGERSLLDLIASLRSAEPEIDMRLIACGDGPLIHAARSLGVQVELLPMPADLAGVGRGTNGVGSILASGPAAYRFGRLLRNAVAAHRPDIIHSNGIKTHLLSGLWSVPQAKLVWHVRDFIADRPIVRRLLRWAARPSMCIIANSQAVAQDVQRALGGKAQKVRIEVVYNGIDTESFSPGTGDSGLLDRLAGVGMGAPGTVRVGLVATYARWKGQDLFLQAARNVLDQPALPPIRFYIIGGAIYLTEGSQFSLDELRQIADRRGVSENVAFVPWQQDMAAIYRSLDIVVHASTRPEPFGRTIIEGMSCGKPVIVSPAGGAGEVFTPAEDALTFDSGHAASLADAILQLATDHQMRCRLGKAARQTVLDRFDRHRLGPQLLRIYGQL